MRNLILLLFFTFTLSLHAQRTDFVEIDFKKADAIAMRYQGEVLKSLPVLALRLTAQLHTDVERFRAIYYWITHNVRGDYHMTSQNEYKRKKFKDHPKKLQQWNHEFTKEVFTKLREEKTTLCTGYAYLVKELANLVGLECEIVHGYGTMNVMKLNNLDIPNHSWNVVKLNGTWYLCDATWSSGTIDMSNYRFTFSFDDTFFLTEPSEFAKNHKPLDEKWSLLIPSVVTNK